VDTQLSELLCLKRLRADKAVGTVSAGSIGVHCDVLEHRLSHLFPGVESLTVYNLYLERVEKTLGTGIVVTVALRAHAAKQLVLAEPLLVNAGTVLTAAVRVHNDPDGHSTPP